MKQHPENTHPYAVYALGCTPSLGDDEPDNIRALRRRTQAIEKAGYPITRPDRQGARALNNQCQVYYVGHLIDVERRVRDHITGADKSAAQFTNTFSPVSLVELIGRDTKKEAEELEATRAREINEQEGLFVFTDMVEK